MSKIVDFLIPSIDVMQIGFFGFIAGVTVITIASSVIYAKPNNWEKKWNGASGKNAESDSTKLDSDHGSVHELSTAVATLAEKTSDIMPGMLLIVGLLGTFLGLGMALNDASMILSSASQGDSGTEGAMGNLLGMMQGLGTKFKTSTWGIIAFLLIKCSASIVGYEEKRLSWCIAKVKQEFDRRREASDTRIIEQHDKIVKSIAQVSKILIETAKVDLTQNKNMTQVLNGILESSNEVKAITRSLNDATVDNINAMQKSSALMAKAASEVGVGATNLGHSAVELRTTVGEFKAEVMSVLSEMQNNLQGTISSMNDDLKSNIAQMSTDLRTATSGIGEAVVLMSSEMSTTMDSVKRSIEKSIDSQQKIQMEFVGLADTLNAQVTAMTNTVNVFKDDVQQSLGSVARLAQSMSKQASASETIVSSLSQLVDKLDSIGGDNVGERMSVISETVKSFKDDVRESFESANSLATLIKSHIKSNETIVVSLNKVTDNLMSMGKSNLMN